MTDTVLKASPFYMNKTDLKLATALIDTVGYLQQRRRMDQ